MSVHLSPDKLRSLADQLIGTFDGTGGGIESALAHIGENPDDFDESEVRAWLQDRDLCFKCLECGHWFGIEELSERSDDDICQDCDDEGFWI